MAQRRLSVSSVGLCEPIDSKCLGLYPAWVIATKKSLLLSITQRDVADAVEGFRADVDPLRETFKKQHKAMVDSLKIEPSDDSPFAMCEVATQKRNAAAMERKNLPVTDDDKARVAAVEESVHTVMVKVMEVSKQMESIPKILQLIDNAKEKGKLDVLVGGK